MSQQLSRRDRQEMRLAMGPMVGPEKSFEEAREEVWGEICEHSDLQLDPADMLSVWAKYDETMWWLLSLPHVREGLPPPDQWRDHVLVSILTNDGTPMHGRSASLPLVL